MRARGASRRSPRRRRAALIAAAALLFLVLSAWLARFLSTENAERDAIVALLRRQAAGDAEGMLGRLRGCPRDPACVAAVSQDARSERTSGAVQILALSSPTAYTLTQASGETRVAWRAGSGLPVVQCVLVERTGNALTGLSVVLRRIGAPIKGEADCP